MSQALGNNLKLLCSHYRSIAEVCRKLAINRAQFNKYLGG
ncbi:XRE family transcriptional regulator, partial [Salmonella enterica subsp. enterica]|nr:XRE family transcriptional regulator [Salmonella enterica subsp. enterica serovar Javiana]